MISYFSFPVSAFDFHSVFLFAFVCCDFRVFENTAQQYHFEIASLSSNWPL